MRERARFAPSPTGPLHIGGVRTALFNYLIAKKNGGDFILRIEDTDTERTVDGAEKYIIESLKWLGLHPDEKPYKQSKRQGLYLKHVNLLVEKGCAYHCFDTPQELKEAKEKHGNDFKYRHDKSFGLKNTFTINKEESAELIEKGEFVIRMVVPKNERIQVKDEIRGALSFNSDELEDKIILKSDKMPTYHLANVVDDNDMKITSVVRGEEWLSSLPFHVLLYRYFDWAPPKFYHLPLILKSSGKGKLSKRDAEEQGFPVFPIKWQDSRGFKEYGFLPEGLINYLALLGWSNESDKEKYTIKELVSVFDSSGIQKSGARFDIKKATWVNHLHVQECSPKKIIETAGDQILGLTSLFGDKKTEEIISLIKDRVNILSDIKKETKMFMTAPSDYDAKTLQKLNNGEGLIVLNFCNLEIASSKKGMAIKEGVFNASAKNNISFGQTMKTLRLALVGSLRGPDLFRTIEIIGADEATKRINKLIKTLKS